MGLGHVSAGSVPAEGAGAQLPRRKHRGTRAGRPALTDRRSVGRFGEFEAAAFLARRGLTVEGTNVRVGRGEVDLLAQDGSTRVAVEVKTLVVETADRLTDPAESFDDRKADQVWSLARELGCRRVDLVTVSLLREGVAILWVPAVW